MWESVSNSWFDDETLNPLVDSTSAKSLELQEEAREAIERGDIAAALRIVAPLPVLEDYWLFERAIASGQHQIVWVMLHRRWGLAKDGSPEGTPVFLLAAQEGHLGIVRDLVEAGADVNWSHFGFFDYDSLNNRGSLRRSRRYHLRTALEVALTAGHRGVADFLAPLTEPWLRDRSGPDKSGLEADYFLFLAADANRHDYAGIPAFDPAQCPEEYRRAAEAGRIALAQVALARGADTRAWFDEGRNTALHIAAEEGDEELARFLLASGADIESRARDGATPLWRAVEQAEVRLVRHLLAAGAEADVFLNEGAETPLWRTVVRDQVALARVLLAGGASPDTREVFTHRTPLMHAARRGRHEMAVLLLEYGADSSAVDWGGISVLGYIRDRPGSEDLETLLRSRGAR